MHKMIEIASKIKELDGGEFQKLADQLLLEKGYKNYNPLGSMSTSKKTTKGIPDTYFSKDEKYVFVMHTTDKDTFNKLEKDLNDCLLLIKEDEIQVNEIILCHTSDNITTVQQKQLYQKVKSLELKLSIYGIGEISRELYQSYPWIAKDILGVSIDTEQILTLKEFSIGRGLISLPDLTTDFVGRTKEISDLRSIFNGDECVIISGKSGSGKSKIAYEIGLEYEKKGYSVYVLKSRKMNIYDDIKRYLSSSSNLFLIIDDAFDFNSQLQIIIEELFSKKSKSTFKVLMTTRDYQLDRLNSELSKLIKFKIYDLALLENEKIEEIVKKSYPITNTKYLEQIVKLSAGNPRLALMAGKTAVDTKKIPYDATQIYDDYYNPILMNIEILKNKKTLKILGLISFFGPILITDLKNMIFNEEIITKTDEIDSLIDEIEVAEVIEVHKNKVVYITDQGFRNYFFKHIFIDLKILSIESILKNYFSSNREKVVDFFNTIFGIYASDKILVFLKNEVNKAWAYFENGSVEDKLSYAQVFKEFNIEKTILICDELIEYDKENREKLGILYNTFSNAKEIINLLVSVKEIEYRTVALKKAIDFVINTGNYSHLEKVLMHYYSINPNSELKGYEAQKYIVLEFSVLTNNGTNQEITLILLKLYSELLKTSHTPTSFEKNNYVLYSING